MRYWLNRREPTEYECEMNIGARWIKHSISEVTTVFKIFHYRFSGAHREQICIPVKMNKGHS